MADFGGVDRHDINTSFRFVDSGDMVTITFFALELQQISFIFIFANSYCIYFIRVDLKKASRVFLIH